MLDFKIKYLGDNLAFFNYDKTKGWKIEVEHGSIYFEVSWANFYNDEGNEQTPTCAEVSLASENFDLLQIIDDRIYNYCDTYSDSYEVRQDYISLLVTSDDNDRLELIKLLLNNIKTYTLKF